MNIVNLKTYWYRWRTKSIAFIHDLCMVIIAWLTAYWLRDNLGVMDAEYFRHASTHLPVVVLIQAICFWSLGLYRGIWRFASIPDLIRIVKATVIGALACMLVFFFQTRLQTVPRSIIPIYAMLLTALLGGPRLLYRMLKDQGHIQINGKRVLIVGAGSAGEGLVRDLKREKTCEYQPVAFVDEGERRQGREMHGVRILGGYNDIPRLCRELAIELIFIALPTASASEMQYLMDKCEYTQLPVRILPTLTDIAEGHTRVSTLREVSLDDLLGRDPVSLDRQAIHEHLSSKVILVSGAGGSIGSELCQQILELGPDLLIALDSSEYQLYQLERQLNQQFPHVKLQKYLVDVLDRTAIEFVLETHRPHYIFHAAAYKHVPMLEFQIRTAMRNNILGTWNLAQAAVKYNVNNFVLISTDKAVNPTNVMGASKRVAEIICQNFNDYADTKFITVRFGNVLGSAGSVVPLFKEQLAKGEDLTVTHPEITRFFMTIPEACQLITQASTMGIGGEIYVLDMGEPIQIRYLAEQLIKLSGKQDVKIRYTGLRPGEKLYEELFHEAEMLTSTNHPKILKAHSRSHDWKVLNNQISVIESACAVYDEDILFTKLQELVPECQFEQHKKAVTDAPSEVMI